MTNLEIFRKRKPAEKIALIFPAGLLRIRHNSDTFFWVRPRVDFHIVDVEAAILGITNEIRQFFPTAHNHRPSLSPRRDAWSCSEQLPTVYVASPIGPPASRSRVNVFRVNRETKSFGQDFRRPDAEPAAMPAPIPPVVWLSHELNPQSCAKGRI